MTRMDEKTLTRIAIACFVLGVALMIPFEATVTRILGVASLAAFIVIGVFAIARPERLGDVPRDDD
jgi:hypothetical protein